LQKYIPEMSFAQRDNKNLKKLENNILVLNQKTDSEKLINIEAKLEKSIKLSNNVAENNKRLLSLNDEVRKSFEESKLLKEEVERVKKTSAPASVVLSMVNRIDLNESKIKGLSKQSEDGALIVMGTILIKDAIERGDNYFIEAEILKEISKNSKNILPEVKVISEFSNKNIVKRNILIKEFNKCAADAVSMSEMKGDDDWKNKVYNKFKSLVKVRRTDISSEEDMSIEAVLARAERFIEEGQIEKAVKEVEKSNQDSHIIKRSGFEDWLIKAKDRVQVEKAIYSILAKSLAIIKVSHLK
jgi:hypothetical protein